MRGVGRLQFSGQYSVIRVALMKSCGFSNYRLVVLGLLLSITLMPVFAYGQHVQTLRFFHNLQQSAPPTRFASGNSALGIPFELTSNVIFLQVRVNGSEAVWCSDSHSVVIVGLYLPLDHTDGEERQKRQSMVFTIEAKVPAGETTVISNEDLRLLEWKAETNSLVLVPRKLSRVPDVESKIVFHKTGEQWEKVTDSTKSNGPEIVLDEDMNTPPRIVAVDPATHHRAMLLDLNPQFKDLRFAKEEEIHWKGSDGHDVMGGLYYPVDYVPGKRYPLVIQTHYFNPRKFWIDGPWTTAFAAQPLRNLRRVPRKPQRRITDHAAWPHIQILQNFL